jgi:hypothetical protein
MDEKRADEIYHRVAARVSGNTRNGRSPWPSIEGCG